jgi:hypothetical protein
MGKYILKYVDDVEDDLAATVTYEFKTDSADGVTWHLSHFMRAVGFGWVESLEIVNQKFGEDGFDESTENSNEVRVIIGSDYDANNVSVTLDTNIL